MAYIWFALQVGARSSLDIIVLAITLGLFAALILSHIVLSLKKTYLLHRQ